MGRATVIRCDAIWHTRLDSSAIKDNKGRNFLIKDERKPNTHSHETYYAAMRSYLNHVKDDAGGFLKDVRNDYSGRLLRGVWRTYEDELMIHDYNSEKNYAEYGYEEINEKEVGGIFINLEREIRSTTWVEGYHFLFHEFFHNIYDIAKTEGRDLKNTDIIERFGKTIIDEVNAILREENDNTKKAADKRLQQITFGTSKRLKSTLYNIIGAVLYKGKYGCNPANSNLYTRDKKECKDRLRCRLQTNDWCDEIFGHGSDYWPREPNEFRKFLAEEAFVDMAATAIVNPKAYMNIKKYMPKSEDVFIEILEKIVNCAPLV
ncbi:MAG: hypothetical protein LBU89_02865 [Fibromonadaceae bacterium]|jgi:hypothetical protein|nr:hypothetical protein [Fibromonadaceae bacterium]